MIKDIPEDREIILNKSDYLTNKGIKSNNNIRNLRINKSNCCLIKNKINKKRIKKDKNIKNYFNFNKDIMNKKKIIILSYSTNKIINNNILSHKQLYNQKLKIFKSKNNELLCEIKEEENIFDKDSLKLLKYIHNEHDEDEESTDSVIKKGISNNIKIMKAGLSNYKKEIDNNKNKILPQKISSDFECLSDKENDDFIIEHISPIQITDINDDSISISNDSLLIN